MKYHHLFWDFDGTLYNSYPQIAHAMGLAFKDCHINEPSPEALLRALKKSVHFTIVHYSQQNHLEPDALLKRFNLYHQAEGFFPPIDGLKECLTALKAAGATHYLYTHRDIKAWQQLERDGLRALFADGITSEDGFPQKPEPDALLSLIAKHGLAPEDCAMIGDRDIDIQSGHNAGIAGALLDAEGYYPEVRAEITADSLQALADKLLQ